MRFLIVLTVLFVASVLVGAAAGPGELGDHQRVGQRQDHAEALVRLVLHIAGNNHGELGSRLPGVYEQLYEGHFWTRAAEESFLEELLP